MDNDLVTVTVTMRVDPASVHRRVGNVSSAPLLASLTEALDGLFTNLTDSDGDDPNTALVGSFTIEEGAAA
jgi:hypothetical protein